MEQSDFLISQAGKVSELIKRCNFIISGENSSDGTNLCGFFHRQLSVAVLIPVFDTDTLHFRVGEANPPFGDVQL